MIKRIATVLVAVAMLATPALAANVQTGKKWALKHCAKCHGEGGEGNGPALAVIGVNKPIANWTKKSDMSKWTEAKLTEIIEKGGKAVGMSSKMPAYGHKLSKAQIADLVAYIQSIEK